jgi:flavin-dependent dehydrogenase
MVTGHCRKARCPDLCWFSTGRRMKQSFDVCVFGAGPAGASTAAHLADLGVTVLVLDRFSPKKAWGGESFTGAIRFPLSMLGLWEDFLNAGHVPGFEQRTGWGGVSRIDSSIYHHHGNLWHVDRERFDEDLREAVRQRAIPIETYQVLNGAVKKGDEWSLRLDEFRDLKVRYLVDASGRSRALSRRFGARPRQHDRLIAMTALIPRNANPEYDHTMMIETAPQGWWYAAPVPKGHVLAFFTDADLVPRELAQSMRPVPANSSYAQSAGEQGWITVGDACAAHDPLCGWGVNRAMNNGMLAAQAICHFIRSGDTSQLEQYRSHCRRQFDRYLIGLVENYRLEQRWSLAPFWARRSDFQELFS